MQNKTLLASFSSQVSWFVALFVGAALGLGSCGGAKANPPPSESKPTEGGIPVTPTMLSPKKEIIQSKGMIGGVSAEELDDEPSLFGDLVERSCTALYNQETATTADEYALSQKGSGVGCWPSQSCEGSVENAAPPLGGRKLKFGEQTGSLETELSRRFQTTLERALPSFHPQFIESDTGISFVWRDTFAKSEDEKKLRDTYKIMAIWGNITLRWIPCKKESGVACSVQPQIQFSMLAVTPKTGGGLSNCTLYHGIPSENNVTGFSQPSDQLKQVKQAIRPALEESIAQLGTCGDNIVQNAFEECDDQNVIDGDGCSSQCKKETP